MTRARTVLIFFILFLFVLPHRLYAGIENPTYAIALKNQASRIIQEISIMNSKTGVTISISFNKKISDSLKNAVDDFCFKTSLIQSSENKIFITNLYSSLILIFNNVLEKNIKRGVQIYLVSDLIQLLNFFSTNLNSVLSYQDVKHLDPETQYKLLKHPNLINLSSKQQNKIIFQYLQKNSTEILSVLMNNPALPRQDSLLNIVIGRFPEQISELVLLQGSKARSLIRNSRSKNLNYIYTLLRSNDKYAKALYPFFSDIDSKKVQIEDIIASYRASDKYAYYHHLVKMRLKHLEQIAKTNDTPLNFNLLYKSLTQYADKYFITKINERHYLNDKQRFKILRRFSSYDLYYLIVCGGDVLYTSSFIYVYKSLVLFFKNRNIITLLNEVYYDKYRKFIKTVATYDYLEGKSPISFFNLMNKSTRFGMLHDFISNLSLSDRLYLENATDIIGSFTGIKSNALSKEILANITFTLDSFKKLNNKKGILIYSIFEQIVRNHYNLSSIDSNYEKSVNNLKTIPLKTLQSVKNKTIYEQVFFYGDDDAVNSYKYLLYTFNREGWRIQTLPHWVLIESTKGSPIKIFVNKPQYLDTSDYLSNQIYLRNFLFKNKIEPKIVMHRGHSYFLSNTINQLPPSTALLILGACGSNSSIHSALEVCSDAQIISTRQIATSVVNSKIFYSLNEDLRKGNPIDWRNWKKYGEQFLNTKYKDSFDEYILPYNNLVNIFFKLYYQRISELY